VEAQVHLHHRQQTCAGNPAQCAGQTGLHGAAQPSLGGRNITYIRTRSGWLYLAVVLDLFARKVVSSAMVPDTQSSLVCGAPQLAIVQRQLAPGLIVPRMANSERDSEYASDAHQGLTTQHGLLGGMSRKGNCWRAVGITR
jgi:transposase InsO family protein